MAQSTDYVARMIAQMALTEPTLDTGIGSTVRKIFDAVGEVASQVTADQHLLNYTFDINSKVGPDLDDFLLMFGFIRHPARRATGLVTFTRTVPATQDYFIPAGTQVATGTSPAIVFETVAPAYLVSGGISVDVPIMSVLAGVAGNLPIAAITTLTAAAEGVSSRTTNLLPTSGGFAAESDDSFRERFKREVFRSLAGTEDMFRAMATEETTPNNPNDGVAYAVNVLGASSWWREQVQIVGGAATSTIPAANVRYLFPNSSIAGSDIDSGQILTPGVHYSYDTTVTPPKINILNSSVPDGDFLDLTYEYCSSASRNDPANGITNRVDIWVAGTRAVTATETVFFRTTTPFVSSPATSPYLASNFVRLDTNNLSPTVGNLFTPLAFGPIIAFPKTLTISGVTYVQGTDYWVVHNNTAFGYGPTSMFGIEWLASRALPANTPIILSGVNGYSYNALPSDVENRETTQKLVTTDARAHQGKPIYLRFTLAIMIQPGFSRAAVADALKARMSTWITALGFKNTLQVSDLLHEAHSVLGVDNVRLTTAAEPYAPSGGTYGIEQVTPTGTAILRRLTAGRSTDIIFADNEVPVLQDLVLVFKAANSFGVS